MSSFSPPDDRAPEMREELANSIALLIALHAAAPETIEAHSYYGSVEFDPQCAQFYEAVYQGLPGLLAGLGAALDAAMTENERLRKIEQAARDYCAINGTARYNRLIEALNEATDEKR